MASDVFTRWRYKLVPDKIVGEILSKSWVDSAIPFLFLLISLAVFGALLPSMFTAGSMSGMTRTAGEYLLVALGLTIVIMAGGIDLSVGSVFALANLSMLALGGVVGLPWRLAALIVLAMGGLIGLVNGLLIGYLRLRAFLTTLVMLIICRAITDALLLSYSKEMSSIQIASPIWDFLAFKTVFGVAPSFLVAVALAALAHFALTRLRAGWHILAVGGSRRAALNAGIDVRRTVCMTYVMSGALTAAAGIFYAARLASLGNDTGLGLEITILTAVVLGGTSLGGGRGSVFKTFLGVVIVVIITNSLIRLGLRSGASSLVLGSILLLAVAIDVRWLKNRSKLLARSYLSPTFFALPPLQKVSRQPTSPYAINDLLSDAEPIGWAKWTGPRM